MVFLYQVCHQFCTGTCTERKACSAGRRTSHAGIRPGEYAPKARACATPKQQCCRPRKSSINNHPSIINLVKTTENTEDTEVRNKGTTEALICSAVAWTHSWISAWSGGWHNRLYKIQFDHVSICHLMIFLCVLGVLCGYES
jgi:hypothetical protein